MAEKKFYVICDDDCRIEGMTKEQIIAAIAEATGATPTAIDSAFITKIKEQNAGNPISFWLGTEAQFNAAGINAEAFIARVDKDGKVYICTDDSLTANALPITGGEMEGLLTTKGLALTEGVDYGTEYPSEAVKGQVFLLEEEPEADYVVAQGITDGWTWRKWNSGIAECWATIGYDAHTSYSNSSGLYYHKEVVTLPFVFVEAPCATFSVLAGNGFACPGRIVSDIQDCTWYVSSTLDNMYIGIHMQVFGRWK